MHDKSPTLTHKHLLEVYIPKRTLGSNEQVLSLVVPTVVSKASLQFSDSVECSSSQNKGQLNTELF